MNPLALLTDFVALNLKFLISCTLAGIIAMLVPQIRRPIIWLLRRVAWYRRTNLIPYLIIQFAVVFVMVRFLLHINIFSNPPQVVYMMIDAKNGTRTRMTPEDYNSHSSKLSQASGLSGAEWAKAQAEEVAAYWAEKKFNEELKRAGYPVTTTTDTAMATSVI